MLFNCGVGEDSWESLGLQGDPTSPPKVNQSEYSLEGLMLKLKLQYFGHLMWRIDSFEKTLMLGKIEGRRRRGQQRMRWLDGITNQLNGHEFGWTLGVGDGHGGLACCSPWGHKESDTTEWLNWTQALYFLFLRLSKWLTKGNWLELSNLSPYHPAASEITCLFTHITYDISIHTEESEEQQQVRDSRHPTDCHCK